MDPSELEILRKESKLECIEERIRVEKRREKFGDEYASVFKRDLHTIATPNTNQTFSGIYGPICYVCRSVLAPSETDGEYATAAYCTHVSSKMYKPHFACFTCCKAWKPTEREDVHTDYFTHLSFGVPAQTRCSSCHDPGTYMGLNFRAPPKHDKKAWAKAHETILANPCAFEAKCKCVAVPKP